MSSTAPLRILLLTPLWSHDGAGTSGIANHFHLLARSLVRNGHEVVVCWIPDPMHFNQPEPAPQTPAGLRVVKVNVSTRLFAGRAWFAQRLAWQLFALPAALRALTRLHRETPFDAVETTSFLALGLLPDLFAGLPPIFTRISTTLDQLATNHTGAYSRALRLGATIENICVRRATLPLTHTRRHREELRDLLDLDPRRVALVPHGIESAPPVAIVRLQGAPALLYLGNAGHRKGVDVLIAAAPSIFRALPDAVLHLAGMTGEEPDIASALASLETAFPRRVVRHGIVDAAKREGLYSGCDAVLVPSRYESFGLPLVEAMRHGRSVIATNAGGMPEVVGEPSTALPPPDDPAAFARAVIARCKDSEEITRRGISARHRFEAHFTTATLSENSIRLYRARCVHLAGEVL